MVKTIIHDHHRNKESLHYHFPEETPRNINGNHLQFDMMNLNIGYCVDKKTFQTNTQNILNKAETHKLWMF